MIKWAEYIIMSHGAAERGRDVLDAAGIPCIVEHTHNIELKRLDGTPEEFPVYKIAVGAQR